MGKNDFKHLNQEFDSNVLDLVNKKGFYPYTYMSDFENLKEKFPSKEKFYSLLTVKELMVMNMNMLLKFGMHLK